VWGASITGAVSDLSKPGGYSELETDRELTKDESAQLDVACKAAAGLVKSAPLGSDQVTVVLSGDDVVARMVTITVAGVPVPEVPPPVEPNEG
jgi:hypothetical protein